MCQQDNVFGAHTASTTPAEGKKADPEAGQSSAKADLIEGPLKPPGEEDAVEDNMMVSHSEGNTRTVIIGEGKEEGGTY